MFNYLRNLILVILEVEAHQLRTAGLAVRLGKSLGLSWWQREILRLGARLHDIGKYGVPHEILLSTERLSDEEWRQVRSHPQNGYNWLFWLPEAVREIALNHHKGVESGGYPNHETEPSLLAQIVAVADVYDALNNRRAYKDSWQPERIWATMEEDAAKGKLNAEVVGAMRNLITAKKETN